MKPNRKSLLACLAVPLGAGALSALLTRDGMELFQSLEKPPLTPPGWLFPPVWTVLYLMMGLASYLVLRAGCPRSMIRRALAVYGLQLFFNFVWTLLFFNLGAYLLSFFWLAVLWLLILANFLLFYRISRSAGWLLLPYLLWVLFAGYLNLGIYLLNR